MIERRVEAHVKDSNQSVALGSILGVLVALRLLVYEVSDPRFATSITARQVFYWGTAPGLIGGLALLGAVVGWCAGRMLISRYGLRGGVSTSLIRSVWAVIAGYAPIAFLEGMFAYARGAHLSSWSRVTGNVGTVTMIVHAGLILTGSLLGGYIAVLVGKRHDTKDALLLGIAVVLVGLYEIFGTQHGWPAAVAAALPLPSALVGAYVRLVLTDRARTA